MKHSTCGDLGVFDFKEEDEVSDTYSRWSKFSSPNCEDPAIKYQFLQYASTASIVQTKEGHIVEDACVVAIDDDGNDFVSDITHGSIVLLKSAGSRQKDGTGVISDRPFVEPSVNSESSCQHVEINVSRHFTSTGIGVVCSTIPESPSSNGSIDARKPDGHDISPENSSSTPTSPVKENNSQRDVQAEDQPLSSLEMEEMDAIALHTDYVTYCNKYFPASFILFSKCSVRVKASSLEDDSNSCKLEWEIDDIVSIGSCWSSVVSIAKVKIHLSTKDAMQEENAHDTSDIEVLEFLIHDSQWPWREEQIMSLNTRYKIAWSMGRKGKGSDGDAFFSDDSESSSYPYIPNFEEAFDEVVYPKGDVDAVSISRRDVDLLQPETFVNDTIIDFYIKYLKNQIPPQERHRYHFFNSFFFRKLADLDKNPTSAFDSKAAFQRVRKWTRKVNIFEKDYIFIPVNYSLHWSLIVICHPGEVANFKGENIDESLKVPCILHMDSIRGSHSGLKDLVQSYLLEEWKERQKEISEDISSNFSNLRFLSLELPQQENCFDCGLFLLHYAELFIAEAPANFNPFRISKYDNFLKPDWFMPSEASLKRVHIQRLIYDLLENRSEGSPSSPCRQDLHPLTKPENNEDTGIEIISERSHPGKSWNANLPYPQSVQGIEMGMLDVSLYRSYDSGIGMQELLQHCQQYDQGSSSGRLRCHHARVREDIDDDEYLTLSTFSQPSLQPVVGVASGACHISYSSRDCNGGYGWHSEVSDHAERERNSSPTSNCSSDESDEMEIIEFDPVKHRASTGQNQSLDHQIENVDFVTESHTSTSSDMKGIPAEEDFHEPDKFNGSSLQDQEDELVNPNRVAVLQPSDQEQTPPDENSQELDKFSGHNIQDQEDELPSPNREEVLQPSDQERTQQTPPDEGPQELHKVNGSNLQDQEDKLVNLKQEELLQPSDEELIRNEDERTMVVEDSSSDSDEEQATKRIRLDGERESIRISSNET